MHIVILDADDTFRESLSTLVRGAGHTVVAAPGLTDETLCSPGSCDLVLVDASDQPDLIPRMRELNPDLPVVAMGRNPSVESIIAALRQGTFDYLIKPVSDSNQLMEVLERARCSIEAAGNQRAFLKRILKTFSELSVAHEKIRERGYAIEGTTEYYYSHFFEDILAIELARSQRFNYSFTIISIRLAYLRDYLSSEMSAEFNSQIEAITDLLHQRVRRTDVLTRTGINEFMIILVETPKEGGLIVAEALRQGIEAVLPAEVGSKPLQAGEGRPFAIGTATYPFDGMECQELIQKACQCQ